MMKYFKDNNAVVYAYDEADVAAGLAKSGLIEMTVSEVGAHLAKNFILSSNTGPTTEQERERVLAVLNPLRDTFLNRLAGIAVFTQDEIVRTECAELRRALLDITEDPTFLVAETYDAMEGALVARYRSITSGTSNEVRKVFRELEV